MTDPDQVLTIPEVAKLLAVHHHTLLRMRQTPDAGGLPWVKISTQRIGYRRGDVEAFLASRRVGTLNAA